eukprot:403348273
MELINEGLVLFTSEILTLFTDFEPSPENRYMVGWVVLSVIVFISLLNMSLFIYSAIKIIRQASKTVATSLKSFIYKIRTMRASFSKSSTMSTVRTSETMMKLNETNPNFQTKSTMDSSIKSIFKKNSQLLKEELRQSDKKKDFNQNSKTVRIDLIKDIESGQGLQRQNTNFKTKISTIREAHQNNMNKKFSNFRNKLDNLDVHNITDDEEMKDVADQPTSAKKIDKISFKF